MEKKFKDPIGIMLGSFESIKASLIGDTENIRRDALTTELPGHIIDTTDTIDCGWETGIKPAGQVWVIVERYNSKEAAIVGHEKWVKTLQDNPKQELKGINYED